jgi:hypothetical protein
MNTNELLPIIRRLRRPLVAADVPPVVVGSVEPVGLEMAAPVVTEPTEVVPPLLPEPVATLSKPAKRKNAKEPATT